MPVHVNIISGLRTQSKSGRQTVLF